MSEKVHVEKINIVIGNKTVKLKLAEAKELQELLNDLFGDDNVNVPHPVIIYPYYEYPRPYCPYRYWNVTVNDTVDTWRPSGGGTTTSQIGISGASITYTLGGTLTLGGTTQ